jgi:hypothetical protein
MIIEFWKTNENPITCYHSKPCVNIGNSIPMTRKYKKGSTIKKAITVEHPNGDKDEYVSVAQTAIAIKMNYSTLCSLLNGRAKNPTEFKIYKSQVNS